MLSPEFQSKLDRIWNTFWANGMTNPLSVMEHINYLLFMRLLDDNQKRQEANARLLGTKLKNPVFSKANEHLRWSNFSKLGADEMLRVVVDEAFPFIKKLGSEEGSSFSRYMEDARFELHSARVLEIVVSEMSAMELHGRDAMGDVYEELLKKVKTSGENGQFRSPTHIINMMVELVEPTPRDTIIDPAFGTAGFLVSAASYVMEHYPKEMAKKGNLEHFKHGMFTGFDIDTHMLRIGAMNLMLHGVDAPDVRHNNSIEADSDTPRGKYTLALANPPFAGNMTAISIAKDLLTVTNTKKTELLFAALFTKLLSVGGRCAAIVPQGVLFGASNAHVSLRKELVEHQCLDAVISLPSGVFKPYSGVATAIILFHKTDNGGTKDVFFYDVRKDGYSLDDKREEIKKGDDLDSDLPDVLKQFKARGKTKRTDRTAQCFLVPKDEIAANGYDLTFNKYKKVAYKAEKLPSVKKLLAEIEKADKEYAAGMKALRGML